MPPLPASVPVMKVIRLARGELGGDLQKLVVLYSRILKGEARLTQEEIDFCHEVSLYLRARFLTQINSAAFCRRVGDVLGEHREGDERPDELMMANEIAILIVKCEVGAISPEKLRLLEDEPPRVEVIPRAERLESRSTDSEK